MAAFLELHLELGRREHALAEAARELAEVAQAVAFGWAHELVGPEPDSSPDSADRSETDVAEDLEPARPERLQGCMSGNRVLDRLHIGVNRGFYFGDPRND